MVSRVPINQPLSVSNPFPKVRMKIVRPDNPEVVAARSSAEQSLQNKGQTEGPSFESVLRGEQEKEKPHPTGEKWTEYTIKQNDTLWALAVKRFHVNVEDIIRDNGIEDPKKIQPGQKIRIRQTSYPERMEVVASWYGQDHHGKPMANGEPFNMNAATIAHRSLPFGTRVELENPLTRQHVRAVVSDRGPYVDGRDVDLSLRLAKKLSLVEKGVGTLVMRVLG